MDLDGVIAYTEAQIAALQGRLERLLREKAIADAVLVASHEEPGGAR